MRCVECNTVVTSENIIKNKPLLCSECGEISVFSQAVSGYDPFYEEVERH